MSETTAGSDVVAMKIKADKKGIDFKQCYDYRSVIQGCSVVGARWPHG